MMPRSWVFRLPPRNLDLAKEHIRWCRDNMGDRGQGWDFSGSISGTTIEIWDSKLAMYYRLKFPEYDTLR
jgi:hypothetical protein